MMATSPARISQLLPTVKCSNCSNLVPLSDLGDHVCPPPPKVPPTPALPKPAVSPDAATALLPPHLQARIASPLSSSRLGSSQPQPPRAQEPPRRASPAANSRPRIDTSTSAPSSYQPSPLSRRDSDDTSQRNVPSAGSPDSPLRTRPAQPQPPPSRTDYRTRTVSNSGSISSTHSSPSTPRPPPQHQYQTQQSQQPYSPSSAPMAPQAQINNTETDFNIAMSYVPPAERGIDTKVGGQAGMAGVGRRGFAAAARAAMFVVPHQQIQGPSHPMGPQVRRPGAPIYVDINTAAGIQQRGAETPPLSSAGSGYSSHSSGPLSPLPQTELGMQEQLKMPNQPPRGPSPPKRFVSPAPATLQPPSQVNNLDSPSSPVSSTRMPFLEKFKNILPTSLTNTTTSDIPTTTSNDKLQAANATVLDNNLRSRPSLDSASSYSNSNYDPTSPPYRNRSLSGPGGSASRNISTKSNASNSKYSKTPLSPVSSEYGLAYADEDDERELEQDDGKKKKASVPPPLALGNSAESILRSNSNGAQTQTQPQSQSQSHVRFPTISDGVTATAISSKPKITRDGSFSSVSSASTGSSRMSSAVIAQALGLSRTPPSEYARLGGPGVGLGRSASGSGSDRSAYSSHEREVSGKSGTTSGGEGMLERLLEERVGGGVVPALPVRPGGLVKSKSTGKQRSFGNSSGGSIGSRAGFVGIDMALQMQKKKEEEEEQKFENVVRVDKGKEKEKDQNDILSFDMDSTSSGSKSQRSNTVQGPHNSPERSRASKLPVRSKTGPAGERDSVVARTTQKREAKKDRACARCQKKIEDGRWVQMDGGSVLCERCWKNMYLPKCRRCNLPIERQAVSSSDGQLKGKYHKECFNCHICHKPFPDKSFYVFDGKPLCAYHYHEANDSLCAAARCGQPIEGPCAVSDNGDRYHPEHMTCEFPGFPECNTRLEEYWEVDGRMLCERHAQAGVGGEEEEEWVQSSRSKKRVTRFIDLTAVGGGVEGSELR